MSDNVYQEPAIHPTTLELTKAYQVKLGDILCYIKKGEVMAVGYITEWPEIVTMHPDKVIVTHLKFLSGESMSVTYNVNAILHVLRYNTNLPRLNRVNSIP